jgi:DNA-binding response OmpR family regulator
MKILIAEDDAISRRVLKARLINWGYEVIESRDGKEAWTAIQQQPSPLLAVLDVMMPGMSGFEVCEATRKREHDIPPYLILLTTKNRREDVRTGFAAGADDYLTKPFDPDELLARVRVGARMLALQNRLSEKVRQLEDALGQVKHLQGILPICGYCKKIRDDRNYWQRVENYITDHSEAQFSHSICPDCYETVVVAQVDKLRRQ